MTLGIDIGTTSVAGVAVDSTGTVVARVTHPHHADIPDLPEGVHEQDPLKLKATVDRVLSELMASAGSPEKIGWTGQMHGAVGVDADFKPVTNFVTWRDYRCYGGKVMTDWHVKGLRPFRCLPICAFVASFAKIDRTFLHSWYLDMKEVEFPRDWLPEIADGCMLGDNQAGVYAAQRLSSGCAVVNLGTSGQLSVVREKPFEQPDLPGRTTGDGSRHELRPYPEGRTLECRASLVGGHAWAVLRAELGITWEEMNARALSDMASSSGEDTVNRRIRACADAIVADLAGDVDLSSVSGLVGVGNALRHNSALKAAVERRLGLPCVIPEIEEMAAYGAALYASGESEG